MSERKAPHEVLEQLARACDAWYGLDTTEEQPGWDESSKVMYRAMNAYRAAIRPLRTRAEVDAEIVRVMRARVAADTNTVAVDVDIWLQLQALCREETAQEPEKPPELKCIGCGLLRCDELTVSVRWDGMVRCADCARHRDTTGKEKWR